MGGGAIKGGGGGEGGIFRKKYFGVQKAPGRLQRGAHFPDKMVWVQKDPRGAQKIGDIFSFFMG